MLKTIAPLAAVVALGFGSAAAALDTTGIIASVDIVGDAVTLTDGATFAFADEAYADRLRSFKPGDQVAISWRHVGTAMEANAISPVTAADLGGLPADYPEHGLDHLD